MVDPVPAASPLPVPTARLPEAVLSPLPPPKIPQWRHPEVRARRDRRRIVALALVGTVVVVLALVALMGWLQPLDRPGLILLGGPTAGLGAVPHWQADGDALRQLDLFDPIADVAETLDEGMDALRAEAGPGPVVVYLAARGWADPAEPTGGSPAIYLGGPAGPTLSEVVAALGQRSAADQLVILDISSAPADPRAGNVDADAVGPAIRRAAIDLIEASKPRRVAVLVSTQPGQEPAASAALGRSVFGYYVEQGLKGAADASGDGRITARELAAFTRDRVARWVRLVLDGEQTPVLYDDPAAADFALAFAPRRLAPPVDLPKEAPAYPDWLTQAWRDRDSLAATGAAALAPRPFGQLEAAVLQAERDWRGGIEEGRLRTILADDLDRLRARITSVRAIPHPPLRSLALEEGLGAVTDPEVLRATREAFARRPKPEPDGKPGTFEAAEARAIAEFFDPAKLKLRSEFDLAHAVFRVATDDPAPSVEAIGFLNRLVAIRQPNPLYAETAALGTLEGRTRGDWRAAVVRRWLLLVRDGERVDADPMSLAGGTTVLDEIARLRHEADVVWGAPGFATALEVDQRLAAAQGATNAALARLAIWSAARRLADEASRVLPAAAALLGVVPDLERTWLAAADEAAEVFDRLGRALETGDTSAAESLGDRVEALRAALAPFGSERIAARVERVTRPEPAPGPAAIREIDALLATVLPTADARLALWKAAIDAERRLVAMTIRLDARDGRQVGPGATSPARTATDRFDWASSSATLRRLRVSGRLLALGGLAPAGGSGEAAGSKARVRLWADPGATLEGRSPAERDRLSRLVPPWVAVPALDEPAADPTWVRRSREFQRLQRWLRDQYAFVAGDAGGSGFAVEVARDYQIPGESAPSSLRWTVGSSPPLLNPEHPEATIRLGLRFDGSPDPTPDRARARAEVAAAETGWLELAPGLAWPVPWGAPPRGGVNPLRFNVPVGVEPVEVPIRVKLRENDAPAPGPIPPGLIVRARLGPRTAHRLIPLRAEPASYRLQVALTADPAGTGPDLGSIRLRAAQGKTSYFLHVRNPGVRDRTLTVALLDRRGPIPGAVALVSIRAGESARVNFGPAGGKPEEGGVEIQGPLSIRLTDQGEPPGAVARTIPVGLAVPAEYVRVAAARFEPAGPRNGERSRLDLRLRLARPIEGPPCPVELSVVPDRIPGLIAPGEGTYAGKLAKLTDEAVLIIDGIQVSDRVTEPGFLDLAVDGIERGIILRGPLGARTTGSVPVQVTRPAIRLRVEGSGLSSAPLPVGIELDSPPDGGRVVVEVGQPTADGFRVDASAEADAGRGLVRLNPRGADGALVFEASVRNPTVALEIGKIRGRRLIQARLLDELGQVKATAEVPLVLDDRAPGDVELISPPKYALKGGTVTLRAVGAAPESGLKEVAFFLGRPVDGKRPAGIVAVRGTPIDSDRTTWVASVPVGETKLGPADVSVEFVAGVGLGRFSTATVAVVEAIPVEPGTIRGTVVEGSRPQPSFDVRILDDKGVEKKKTKADDQGKFVVDGLPPGSYEVVSVKETPPTRGSTRVTLGAGETKEIEVAMYRTR